MSPTSRRNKIQTIGNAKVVKQQIQGYQQGGGAAATISKHKYAKGSAIARATPSGIQPYGRYFIWQLLSAVPASIFATGIDGGMSELRLYSRRRDGKWRTTVAISTAHVQLMYYKNRREIGSCGIE